MMKQPRFENESKALEKIFDTFLHFLQYGSQIRKCFAILSCGGVHAASIFRKTIAKFVSGLSLEVLKLFVLSFKHFILLLIFYVRNFYDLQCDMMAFIALI